MQKKGNTYYPTKNERYQLKKLIDKKYGKLSTSADYESTYGDYDTGLEGAIFEVTREMLSGSTLERLVGLTGKENQGVREYTLLTVSKYLSFQTPEQLISHIEAILERPDKTLESFSFLQFFRVHLLRIEFTSNKSIVIRHLAQNDWEVLESNHTKLNNNDRITIDLLEAGEELICTLIIRIMNGKSTPLGMYKSGSNNKVSRLIFTKP